MKFKEALHKLENDHGFKEWRKKHPKDILAHGFMMLEQTNLDFWHIGYYDETADKITSFEVTDKKVVANEPTDIFKRPEEKIMGLTPETISVELADALDTSDQFQKKEYPNNDPQKVIVILQHIDNAQVYNITYISAALNTLTMRVDARTGELVFHKLMPLMEYKQS